MEAFFISPQSLNISPTQMAYFFRKSFYEVAMGLLPHSSGSIKKTHMVHIYI
jgi:hypothetical protein